MDTDLKDYEIKERVTGIYGRLVNETENPDTIHDQRKNELLSKLLDVFEYISGNKNYENPMNDFFGYILSLLN